MSSGLVAHSFSFLCYCVFALSVFVLCLVHPVIPVSLDCPFLIVPSVFSNVHYKQNTARFNNESTDNNF